MEDMHDYKIEKVQNVCTCVNKNQILNKFQQCIKQIQNLYMERIKIIEEDMQRQQSQIHLLESKCEKQKEKVQKLTLQNSRSIEDLDRLNMKNQRLLLEVQKYANQEQKMKARLNEFSQKQLSFLGKEQKWNDKETLSFADSFLEQNKMSAISHKSQNNSMLALSFTQSYRNQYEQILNFIRMIPGESIQKQDERGSLDYMVISKDKLSIQKFEKVNRTFLKRKIREDYSKISLILIFKPEKLEKPNKADKIVEKAEKVQKVDKGENLQEADNSSKF